MAFISALAVLAAVPIVPIILLALLEVSLWCLGFYLETSTRERRQAIRAQVNRDTAAVKQKQDTTSEEEEWEKARGLQTTEKESSKGNGWDGIIGFFHPFWYGYQPRP